MEKEINKDQKKAGWGCTETQAKREFVAEGEQQGWNMNHQQLIRRERRLVEKKPSVDPRRIAGQRGVNGGIAGNQPFDQTKGV